MDGKNEVRQVAKDATGTSRLLDCRSSSDDAMRVGCASSRDFRPQSPSSSMAYKHKHAW